MEIRKAVLNDMDSVLNIYAFARTFMRAHGNMVQWVNGYPQREVIEKDIQKGELYLCIEGDEICAVFFFRLGEDPTYQVIEDGEWLNQAPYGVVHRIASNQKVKGAASVCLNWAFEQCHNLKIDTHESNIPMQNLLKKNGFQRCGIIHLPDGSPRIAFQKEQ